MSNRLPFRRTPTVTTAFANAAVNLTTKLLNDPRQAFSVLLLCSKKEKEKVPKCGKHVLRTINL
jgi:hypothetical protein